MTLIQCPRSRVGAKLVFALLGVPCRWAITRIAPTQCANLLWTDLDDHLVRQIIQLGRILAEDLAFGFLRQIGPLSDLGDAVFFRIKMRVI